MVLTLQRFLQRYRFQKIFTSLTECRVRVSLTWDNLLMDLKAAWYQIWVWRGNTWHVRWEFQSRKTGKQERILVTVRHPFPTLNLQWKLVSSATSRLCEMSEITVFIPLRSSLLHYAAQSHFHRQAALFLMSIMGVQGTPFAAVTTKNQAQNLSP